MYNVDLFMQHKIGLDVINSSKQDIMELSDYIEFHYGKNYFLDVRQQNHKTLFDYYVCLINDDTKTPWSLLVYDNNLKCWNGYRGRTEKDYLEKKEKMTAAEILEKDIEEITDKDLEGLLCLK